MDRKLYKLKGKLQHYQWGGYTFLADLLNLGKQDKPCAEYWLGAHENAPAEIAGNGQVPLNRFIKEHPEVLGEKVRQSFGRLPYLLKVLDVKDMLSIQVHPSKAAAVKEFELENKKGIPLNAGNRNYKDDNHKPELMVALSDFWLLHGFKAEEEITGISQRIPEFQFMFNLLEEGGLQHLYKTLMELDQDKVNRILQPLLDRILPEYEQGKLKKDDPHFWAARAARTFNEIELTDRGIFSVYLLNLVHLAPAEAIFQDAGILHAYLEGQNMEIMANSDNVLRGGLTPKHIDVQELMKHVSFKPIVPRVITGKRRDVNEEVFQSPAPDFQLSRFLLSSSEQVAVQCATTDIFMVMEGSLAINEQSGQREEMKRGEAAVATAGAKLQLTASEKTILYRATVPL
jgi:mannose-6-phosphate isomerase